MPTSPIVARYITKLLPSLSKILEFRFLGNPHGHFHLRQSGRNGASAVTVALVVVVLSAVLVEAVFLFAVVVMGVERWSS